ncbi:mediator of RNA polymerase II transcription subunit 19-like [Drosophila miranda]|uniref:mediator of RNA polymerase II transcription subunit 19-like n=1 Tax=Drosophila miranda TaxID=7229 RepID=UPI0007E684FC|nr:mediator of RNA polymerase II transcription subunit 19-like [Drosophila miranda]
MASIDPNLEITDSTSSPKSTAPCSRDITSPTMTPNFGRNRPNNAQSQPFYLFKEPPTKAELTGDQDLLTKFGLEQALYELRKENIQESLSSFLPAIPEVLELSTQPVRNSTLGSVVKSPPTHKKGIRPLNKQLDGFRLHPGKLPSFWKEQSLHYTQGGGPTSTTVQASTLSNSAVLDTKEKSNYSNKNQKIMEKQHGGGIAKKQAADLCKEPIKSISMKRKQNNANGGQGKKKEKKESKENSAKTSEKNKRGNSVTQQSSQGVSPSKLLQYCVTALGKKRKNSKRQ